MSAMEKKSTLDKFLKGISTQTLIAASNAVLQIVVFAIFSRLLSKEDFGYYAAITGLTMIFMGISDAGIGSAVIQKKELTEKYLSTAFTMSLIVGVLVGSVFFLLSPVLANVIIDEKLEAPLKWMTIPLVLNSVNGYGSSMLRRDLRFGIAGGYKIATYVVSAVASIIYALHGGGVYALVMLYVGDAVLYTGVIFTLVRIPKLGLGRAEAVGVLSFGGWLTLGVIVSQIAAQIDKLVLGKWLSVERLGAYNRPSGFVNNLIGQINGTFDTVLFPILSGFQDSKEHFRRILYSSFGLLTTMGVLLAIVLFFNARLIILIFFGNEWLDLVPIMQISSLSAIFMLDNTLADCFFRSFNLVKIGFFIRSGGIALSLLFISIGVRYDIVGVAFAILTANLLLVIFKLTFLSVKSEARLRTMGWIGLKSFVPGMPIILLGLIFFLLPQSIVFDITKAAVMGVGLLILLLKFPKFVGEEYNTMLYPKIEMLFSKSRIGQKLL